MLRQSATTGGTELAARLLKLKFESISIGTLCLVIDVLVTFGYALIFRDMTRALYGVIALYVSSLLMDRVVYGPNAAKMAYIISERSEEITQKLLELDRGVTLLDGHGAWSGRRKDVILCAFGRSYIVPIKKLVQEIDPDAFVIVCDAHEILGEGFGTYTPGGLYDRRDRHEEALLRAARGGNAGVVRLRLVSRAHLQLLPAAQRDLL